MKEKIDYVNIDQKLLEKIVKEYEHKPEFLPEFAPFEQVIRNHMHFGEDACSVAALHNGKPVGFISCNVRKFEKPMENQKDVYIDIIEVNVNYRRQGIARNLIKQCEEWAKQNGFSQIRSWSSQNKIQAIPMWHALGYCMCPAKIWSHRIGFENGVSGYFVVKKL